MSESELEEPYNADDREAVNKARKKAARHKILREEVIRGIMSVKEGRDWIYHIISMGDMFGNPFVSDTHASYFNGGMANLAKMIWAEVEDAAPEFCAKMLQEAKKNEKSE